MGGAAKKRAAERKQYTGSNSARSAHSGISSSSGKASRDARSISSSTDPRAGYDGNRDPDVPPTLRSPAMSAIKVNPRNLDLGVGGWATIHGSALPTGLPARGPPSTLGIATKVGLNSFKVMSHPTKPVYQFDVLIGNGMERRGLIDKVWKSNVVKQAIGHHWIFDGNKLAWSLSPLDREVRLHVDLDAEQGRAAHPGGRTNKHFIVIRQTNRVGFDVLSAFLQGRTSFDNTVLEAINFLDHLLREYPRQRFTPIKRSFFAKSPRAFDLGSCVEAFKGVYQSLRVVHAAPKQAALSINVDVANCTFWKAVPVHMAAVQLTGARDVHDLANALLRTGEKGRYAKDLKKLRRVHVYAQHRGKANAKEKDLYVIENLVYKGARDAKFEKDGKMTTVYDYFAKEFGIRLQCPELPLVKMTKGKNTLLPMEVLFIEQNQRYPYKLDERQTSSMIRFAVTAPAERWGDVEHGLRMLDWAQDPVLNTFGVQVTTQKTVADARVINAPIVRFGQGEAKPGTSGRWDLKGKKFLTPNTVPLKAWGVCVIPGRRGGKPDKSVVDNFINEFTKIYRMHGGRVEKAPFVTLAQGDDVGQWVTMTWNNAGNAANARPQLLVFVLPDKDSVTYGRIKRSADCRYGVVSQCMQYAHVQKAQGQYISNVCMKVNAKLGGSTGRAIGAKSSGPTGLFTTSTLIIGADVSHAAPGSTASSMAAMTFSMDRLGIRYAAACETNGHRVEMISTDNIESICKPMLQTWISNVGGGSLPNRIIYLRDGVSEGQYQHVLQHEVYDMKAVIKKASPSANIPFTVIIGSKRHHVRFFPDKGDRNGNALPGTLVETGVTNPFENDFYLCSHAAIKGTARPAHYHVLLNEAKMSTEEIQTLLYEHSYQFVRATTPVSQHPAIYYAHIAANRAVPHDPNWSGSTSDSATSVASRPRSGSGSGHGSQGRSGGSSSGMPADLAKLLTMPNQGGIQNTMWFI